MPVWHLLNEDKRWGVFGQIFHKKMYNLAHLMSLLNILSVIFEFLRLNNFWVVILSLIELLFSILLIFFEKKGSPEASLYGQIQIESGKCCIFD